MAVYLKIFPTKSAYEDFITNTADYPKPNISYIEATDEVIFTNYRDITSIEFDNNTYSIVGNEESAISVPFSVIDNWGDDVTENCTFTFSPNDKGLYVDNGYIKVDSAIEGTYNVTITATLGDFTASATIAMQIAAIPHSISFNSNSYTLSGDEGTSIITSYTVTDDLNNDVTSEAVITFSPSNTGITASNGTFNASSVSAGSYTITATATVGNLTTTATINLTVAAVPTSIAFDSNSYTMSGTEGDTIQQQFAVTDNLGNDVSLQCSYSMNPNNTDMVITNVGGEYYAFDASSVSAGTYSVTVTATYNNLTATATVAMNIAAAGPSSIEFDESSYNGTGTEFEPGQYINFVVYDENEDDVAPQCSYSFSPSNTGITADLSGGQWGCHFDFSDVAAGSYTITVTATLGNLSTTSTINLSIAAYVPQSIQYLDPNFTMNGDEGVEALSNEQITVEDDRGIDITGGCTFTFSPNDKGLYVDYDEGLDGYYFKTDSAVKGTYNVTATATFNGVSDAATIEMDIVGYDYSQDYLTFEALESGTFTMNIPAVIDSTYMTSVSYSTDDGATWTTTTIDNTAQTITTPTIAQGDKVLWKGEGITLAKSGSVSNASNFSSTGNFNVSGNIMSLLYGDNFANQTTFPNSSSWTFKRMFYYTNTISVENLVLPATTLVQGCYYSMFENCKALTSVPTLPATTVVDYAYTAMYQGCSALTSVPSDLLPATTLANYCYQYMFQGCTALTTAPTLPATTLARDCYSNMFYGCTLLTTAPSTLPATALTNNCYVSMFQGCTALTTAPTLPATALAPDCYSNMFKGCTSLTTAPSTLPATTLIGSCYANMFYGCTLLTTAPTLPATTLKQTCYANMFKGCTNLNNITMLATDISATNCLVNWVDGVASSGTFTKAASMTTLPSGASGIPSGWSVIDAS